LKGLKITLSLLDLPTSTLILFNNLSCLFIST